MAYDLGEQESIEELKDWWGRHGTLVTAVIVAAALAVFGYRFWNYYQGSQTAKAAVLYEQLEKAISEKQMTLVREVAGTMLDRYAGTAYAEMTALAAARANADAGDLNTARAQLQWAADHARDPEYRFVARLRLASVLLDQGQGDAALKALAGDVPANFQAAFADRRGDILASQNKIAEARAQYQEALAKLAQVGSDVRLAYTNVIQIKLDSLGSVAPDALPKAAAASPPNASPSENK